MAKVLCYDIDGVLTNESDTKHNDLAGTYIYRSPNLGVKEQIRKAYDSGWTITLYTGRREAQRRITEDWLHSHGFHYHFLFMDKPYYTYFVDDRSRTVEQIEKILATANDSCKSTRIMEPTHPAGRIMYRGLRSLKNQRILMSRNEFENEVKLIMSVESSTDYLLSPYIYSIEALTAFSGAEMGYLIHDTLYHLRPDQKKLHDVLWELIRPATTVEIKLQFPGRDPWACCIKFDD